MKHSISILGSGWLGFAVAKKLSTSFTSVKISTRSEDKKRHLQDTGLTPFLIDIDNLDDNIQDFLQSEILLINITSKNIPAFTHLLKEIEVSAVKQVLFISSTSVYANQPFPCSESDALLNNGHPLLAIESLFTHSKYFQTTILRCAGLIGGKRHPGRFFTAPGKMIGNPNAAANLIHLDDCLAIISAIIEQQCWGEVLNACADTHPSKAAFYGHNAQALGLAKPVLGAGKENANKIVSNDKLKRVLDYQFIHGDLMEIDPINDYQ